VPGQANLVQDPALELQGLHPLGDQHPGLDRAAGRDDRRPAQVVQAALRGELRRDLAEERGLQLREVRQEPGHAAGRVMLGQPVGGRHEREHLGARLVAARLVAVLRVTEDLPHRVVLLAVEQVPQRRLLRLVVGRQRAVHQAGRGEQPGLAVGLHDERVGAGDRVDPRGARRRAV